MKMVQRGDEGWSNSLQQCNCPYLCLHIHTPLGSPCGMVQCVLGYLRGGLLHALNLDHLRWDSTLTLNTDFKFRTDSFDPIPEHPSLAERARSLALDNTSSRLPGNCLCISGANRRSCASDYIPFTGNFDWNTWGLGGGGWGTEAVDESSKASHIQHAAFTVGGR